MKLYWPRAIVVDNQERNPCALHTYDSCDSIEEAENVFKNWQDGHHYKLLATWIESDGEIINHAVHVDIVGNIRKI